MSVQYEMRCKTCNKTWNVTTGHNMLDGYKDNVLNHFAAPYHDKVADLIRDLPVPPYGFSHVPGTCKACKEILSVPVIRSGDRFFAEPCPICKGEVQLHEGKPEEMVCPICGKPLEVKNVTFAD
ncbi:MAG: hypothetical protein K5744_00160 [Eubacterium sp.]|jgi:hypothetical protein|nr:hypothetical protein [Eubacterium sp.]